MDTSDSRPDDAAFEKDPSGVPPRAEEVQSGEPLYSIAWGSDEPDRDAPSYACHCAAYLVPDEPPEDDGGSSTWEAFPTRT